MRRRIIIALAILVAPAQLAAACSTARSRDETPNMSTVTTLQAAPDATVSRSADRFCHEADREVTGPVADGNLNEVSGVVASRGQRDVLWVHNDSGAPNVIWALHPDGAVLGSFTVTGARAVDWEDIGLGAGPSAGVAYLYIADTGDNSFPLHPEGHEGSRSIDAARIYRLAEPTVAAGAGATAPAEAFAVDYADGPRDAEALLADPLTGDVYVISKQWDRTAAGLYRLPADVVRAEAAPTATTTMARVGDVAATAGALVTAADISGNGRLVVVRTYTEVLLWDRDPGHGLAETLSEPPTCTRVVEERQGEAVAIDPAGDALVTIGEGEGVPLNWLRLTAS